MSCFIAGGLKCRPEATHACAIYLLQCERGNSSACKLRMKNSAGKRLELNGARHLHICSPCHLKQTSIPYARSRYILLRTQTLKWEVGGCCLVSGCVHEVKGISKLGLGADLESSRVCMQTLGAGWNEWRAWIVRGLIGCRIVLPP